jgi:hypothetical protein
MNESSLFPVPFDLLDHISKAQGSNPELYQLKLLDDAHSTAARTKERLNHLQVALVSIARCAVLI